MRRLASFVAIFILLSAAAPLLACMTGSAMSQEESACCRAMHGNCGDMVRMGCCRAEVRSDSYPQLAAKAPVSGVQWSVTAWLAPILTPIQRLPPTPLEARTEHPPPGLPFARLTVLRI